MKSTVSLSALAVLTAFSVGCEQGTPVQPQQAQGDAIAASHVSRANPASALHGFGGDAPLFDSNDFTCAGGASQTSGPSFGAFSVGVSASGRVDVTARIRGATPNADYEIWINQYPGDCPTTPNLTVTTDMEGNATIHLYESRMEGATSVWISAVGGGQVLRSTAVTQ